MALLSSSVITDAVYMPDGSVTMTTIVMIIQMRGTAVSAYRFALLCTVPCSLATLAHGPISCSHKLLLLLLLLLLRRKLGRVYFRKDFWDFNWRQK